MKNAGAEQYTSRQNSLDSAPEVVRLVDAPSSRAADYAYDVDAAGPTRSPPTLSTRQYTGFASTNSSRAALGVGAPEEKPVKWT